MNLYTYDSFVHKEDGRTCVLFEDGTWFVPLDAEGEGFACERQHGPSAQVEVCDHCKGEPPEGHVCPKCKHGG